MPEPDFFSYPYAPLRHYQMQRRRLGQEICKRVQRAGWQRLFDLLDGRRLNAMPEYIEQLGPQGQTIDGFCRRPYYRITCGRMGGLGRCAIREQAWLRWRNKEKPSAPYVLAAAGAEN